MTKAEIIDAIKAAWVKELMDINDIRDDIAETYANWVRGLVSDAAADLQAAPAAQGQPAQQGGGQEQPQGGGQQPAAGGVQ